MWAISGILLTSGLIVWIEVPYLVRNKLNKELTSFIVLMLIGVTLSILQSFRVPIPTPLAWISTIHKPIREFVLKMLE